MGSVYFIAVLLCMFSCQRKIIRNPLFLIMTTVLLFYAAFSVNNAAIAQQASDSANRTVSLNSADETEAIVAIPTPSVDDLSPETEQQAGTKEKVLENSDESNDDNGAHDKVDQAEIQKDKVSESVQTREDGQEQPSESEEKEDNSDTREEENDNDDDESDDEDVPFVLPFP
jgi:hypothetical protein